MVRILNVKQIYQKLSKFWLEMCGCDGLKICCCSNWT